MALAFLSVLVLVGSCADGDAGATPTEVSTIVVSTEGGSGEASCAQGGPCGVGDIGPAGGIVFYVSEMPFPAVDGIGSGGRFLEAAPGDTATDVAWCSDTTNSVTLDGAAFGTGIGAGAMNTLIMVTGSAGGVASTCTSGAGFEAANLVLNGYSDWFLPSQDELASMYSNLKAHQPPLGDFGDGAYWSSSEVGPGCRLQRRCSAFVWAQLFRNGGQGETSKATQSMMRSSGNSVCAVRAFGQP